MTRYGRSRSGTRDRDPSLPTPQETPRLPPISRTGNHETGLASPCCPKGTARRWQTWRMRREYQCWAGDMLHAASLLLRRSPSRGDRVPPDKNGGSFLRYTGQRAGSGRQRVRPRWPANLQDWVPPERLLGSRGPGLGRAGSVEGTSEAGAARIGRIRAGHVWSPVGLVNRLPRGRVADGSLRPG